ncbi:hypothetical protein G9A89_012215 [Geosiphon pyriformis]|nr:hypothetical protein G9A89_012215 [Geosiphon pyriformis]
MGILNNSQIPVHLLDIEQELLQEVQVLIKHVNIDKLLTIDFINIDKFEPLFTYISEDEIVDLINNKYSGNSNTNKDLESENKDEPLSLLSTHQGKIALKDTLHYCEEQYSKKVDSDFFKTLRTLICNTVLKVQEEKKHQAALDACRSKSLLVYPDFRNHCWIKCHHIVTIICQKNLDVNWVKVKGHSGVSGNERANALAKDPAFSAWHLPHLVSEHFLCAGSTVVFGNSRYFVCDVFQLVHRACWEVGVGSYVVDDSLRADINWSKSSMVWHPNSHLASSFTNMHMVGCCTYFMKALHHRLPVAVHKRLYDRRYPNVVYAVGRVHLLGTYALAWEALSGLSCSSSCVLQALASCVSEIGVGVALCKGFVFDKWFHESVLVFKDSKKGTKKIVSFVCEHQAFMEKHDLIPHDSSTPASVSGLPMVFLAGVVRLLEVAEAFGVGFGFYKFCSFFSGIGDLVSVHIGV